MEPGDWVLFYSDGHFPVCGRVLASDDSAVVADRLWGSDESGTWRYMYLLDEIQEIDLPRVPVLQALGYSESFYPRGFIRLHRDLEEQYGSVENLLQAIDSAKAEND